MRVHVVTERILRVSEMGQLGEVQENFRRWERARQRTGDGGRFGVARRYEKM